MVDKPFALTRIDSGEAAASIQYNKTVTRGRQESSTITRHATVLPAPHILKIPLKIPAADKDIIALQQI